MHVDVLKFQRYHRFLQTFIQDCWSIEACTCFPGYCTGWSRRNSCFSYKNNFVYFQHKKVVITQKRRYFNAFLKYVQNYLLKIMSVRWRPSRRTHIRSLSSKSCIARSNFFFLRHSCDFLTNGNFQLFVTSGSSKCFNPSEYSDTSANEWPC